MSVTSRAVGASAIAASFIADHVPTPVERRLARLSLFDTVAAARLGSASPHAVRLASSLTTEAGVPVLVAGTALRARPDAAAMLFGTFAHAQELDDWAGYGACGAPVWGALLPLAQRERSTDVDALADAFCVGVAIAHAIWSAGGYDQARRGLDGTGVFGSVAAAAACARLLRLPVEETLSALAIAASELGGIVANLGTDAAALHAGLAARNGLQAALLARAGLYGALDILEARQGLGEACFGPATGRLTELDDALGRSSGFAFHRFRHSPCAIDHQRVVAALRRLLDDSGWPAGALPAIGVDGVPPSSEGVRFDIPATAEQARASLRWSVAQVVIGGAVPVEPVALDDAEAVATMERVRIGVVPRWDPSLAGSDDEARAVWIADHDGRRASADPRLLGLTLDRSQVRAKWSRLAAGDWLDRWSDVIDAGELPVALSG
jgi:2-methylcitrate dehydratase PrpD